jgi:hypothetical protein
MPREGETYESPTKHQRLYTSEKTNQGPYYNISVTLDREALNIVDSWPRGTKSERIRWAIKDRHYGRTEAITEEIEMLYRNIEKLQAVILRRAPPEKASILQRLRNLFNKHGR